MLVRIVGGALAVRCADRRDRHADGCDAGALLGALREVGDDGAAGMVWWPCSAAQRCQAAQPDR